MRPVRPVVHLLAGAALLAATASPAAARKYSIDTTPVKEGRVFVDGSFVGVAPVTVDLELRRNEHAVATAEKQGALGLWERKLTRDDRGRTVYVRLEENAALSRTTESDIANTWLTITPRLTRNPDGSIDEETVWQKIVSIVTDNFADLEQLDRSSFYLRTAWRMSRFPHTILRNRLVVKRGVTDQLTVRARLESQLLISTEPDPDPAEELFAESTRIFADDRETVGALRDQL